MVTEYWDMSCDYEFWRPIQRFSFHIDTGNHPPIYCKPPRYGPHESEVMQKLAESLDKNYAAEEDEGPRGELVVLAAKTHQ